jgi:uncharacterized repeat protein (TIGR01451 family)
MSGRRGLAGVMGCALLTSLLVVPGSPVSAAAPDPAPGRLAFTDASDAVRATALESSEDEGGTPYLDPVPGSARTLEDAGRHSGEASGDVGYWQQWDGSYAFISSWAEPPPPAESPAPSPSPTAAAEDPDGEVWYRYRAADGTMASLQVTDDESRQSHPEAWVESTDCYYATARVDVVFASDRSGNWDIWVAHLVAEQVTDETGYITCGPYEVTGLHQVTDDPGDDLWPAWAVVPDGEGYRRSIVFSSTRSDPRGDLYEVAVQPGELEEGASPGDLPLTQLTEGPEADSHPAPRPQTYSGQGCYEDGNDGEPRWVAFTRASDDDPRGGLAVLDLTDPGGGVLSLGVSAAAEPAWSPDGRFVAYRSTADDPDGDVRLGRFERTCPAPDLAVTAVEIGPSYGEAGDPIPQGAPVDVRVVVTNTGGSPADGTVEVDFTDLLTAPGVAAPDSCDGQVCTVAVPQVLPGESHVLEWVASEDTQLDAVELGIGTVTARVSVTDLFADADPGNDELSGEFEVVPAIDLQIPDVEGRFYADPGLLNFDTEGQSLETVITVALLNPDPDREVQATLQITSDSDLVSVAQTDVTLAAGETQYLDLPLTATSPPTGDYVSVVLSAEAILEPPPIDPFLGNNVATTQLGLDATYAVTAGFTGTYSIQPAANAGAVPGRVRQAVLPPTAALPTAARAGAGVPWGGVPAALALPPADVPPPAKPPVDDAVALEDITAVSHEFGAAESHPTFVWDSPSEELLLLYTWRPIGARVSDVLSSDGSDRRVLAEDPTGVIAMGHPSYSPDGRFVAYHRYTCDLAAPAAGVGDYYSYALPGCLAVGAEIVVANADGSDPAVVYAAEDLRGEGVVDLRPAWSPDGTALAFTRIEPAPSEGPEPPSAIWVARGLDLAADPVDLAAETVAQLTTPHRAAIEDFEIDEFDDEAAWSPDGARIAFTRARFDTGAFDGEPQPLDPGAYDSDIWVVEVATGEAAPMLALEVGASEEDSRCPESREVGSDGAVCRGGDDRGADWSPDGTQIVYEHTGWLYLADPDARTDLGALTGPRVLDPSDSLPLYPDDPLDPPPDDPADPAAAAFPQLEWAQDPAWSPNGDRIAFAGQPRGLPDQRGIYWITIPTDPADREQREIAQQPQPEIEPDWQPTADLAITLTAVPASIDVGAASQLTATVTNEGPGRAIDAVATITLPAGLTAGTLPAGCSAGTPITCDLGELADRASATVVLPVTGTVAATHTVDASTSSRTVDPDPADNSASTTVDVVALPTADLAVALTAAPASVGLGGSSQLTVTVSNLGPDAAADAVVTLTLPAELVAGTLPAGCSAGPPISCAVGTVAAAGTVEVVIPVTGNAAGTHAATATVGSTTSDPDPANNTATATVEVVAPPEADLAVALTAAPASVGVGGSSQLTMTVSNLGPDAAADAVVTLTLPAELVAGTLPAGCSAGPPISCAVGTVAAAGVVEVVVPVTGSVVGTHTATATVGSATTDPETANNTASATIEVIADLQSADLSISFVTVPPSVGVGVEALVTATITNDGPSPALGATATITVPADLTVGTLPGGCVAGTPIVCTLGDLPPTVGAQLQLRLTGEVPGTFTISGTTSSGTPDPDPADNIASTTLEVVAPEPQADLAIEVTVDPVPGYVGGEQTVTLSISNVGLVPSAATVTLTLPEDSGAPDDEECLTEEGCSFLEVAAGAQIIRTITLEPGQALRGRARAAITGPLPDPDPSDNEDSARIVVLQPSIQVIPPLGTPGQASHVFGEDFPPNARVSLQWDPGLNIPRGGIPVGDDGTFDIPILVLNRDEVGPRSIVAARLRGERFSDVSIDYLVVPRTQYPPDFVSRG